MSNEKLLQKIQKLKAMAACSGPEADNARRIIDTLIKKYNLDPDEVLDVKKPYKFKVHRLKKYAMMLANWMGEVVYVIQGHPDYIALNLTSDEYKMFYELLDEIKHIFNKKERELKSEYDKHIKEAWGGKFLAPDYINKGTNTQKNDKLRSFMYGYMESNYPRQKDLCLICKKGRVVDNVCDNCGHKYTTSNWRPYSKHQNEYENGFNTTTRKISQNKKRLTYG